MFWFSTLRARFVAVAVGVVLAGCSAPGSPGAAPSVAPADAGLSCSTGDHGLNERELGWAFCYPGTWRFRERIQDSLEPKGVDDTFDIIVVAPAPSAEQGKFAFLIVGTYVRGNASDLASWVTQNVGPDVTLDPIQWGNSKEAGIVTGTHRRYALTPHHVVLLDPRGADGNLDLDGEMSTRLKSWRFDY